MGLDSSKIVIMKVKEKNAMKEFPHEDCELSREALQQAHWDMYKDVYGFRPRHYDYDSMTILELEAALVTIELALERAIKEDKLHEKQSILRFENQVAGMISEFSIDRATAIRWIHEAEGTCENDDLEYHLGLPYGYLYGNVIGVEK